MESALATWRASYDPTVGTSYDALRLYQHAIGHLGTKSITNSLLYDLNFLYWALSNDDHVLDEAVLFQYITKHFKHRRKCGVHSEAKFWLCWFDCIRPAAGDINFIVEDILFRHEDEYVVKWIHWHPFFNSVIFERDLSPCLVSILNATTPLDLVGLPMDHPQFKKKFNQLLLKVHPDKNADKLANAATAHMLQLYHNAEIKIIEMYFIFFIGNNIALYKMR